jgi:hypothetical protein
MSSIKALSALCSFRRQICFGSKCFQVLQSVVKQVLNLAFNANREGGKRITNNSIASFIKSICSFRFKGYIYNKGGRFLKFSSGLS